MAEEEYLLCPEAWTRWECFSPYLPILMHPSKNSRHTPAAVWLTALFVLVTGGGFGAAARAQAPAAANATANTTTAPATEPPT